MMTVRNCLVLVLSAILVLVVTSQEDKPVTQDTLIQEDLPSEGESLGRKTCRDDAELNKCVAQCESHPDCKYQENEMNCEDECLLECRYIERNLKNKCVVHMMAVISNYRFPDRNNIYSGSVEGKPMMKPPPSATKSPGMRAARPVGGILG